MQTTTQPTVMVNGEVHPIDPETVLSALLEEKGIEVEQVRGIAVAVNDSVVRRANWSSHMLQTGDRIEIVTAKQGG